MIQLQNVIVCAGENMYQMHERERETINAPDSKLP